MSLHFMRPEWLWSLLPAALLGLWMWHARRRSGSWSDVIAPELLRHLVRDPAAGRAASWLPLAVAGWALAAVAASGPSWEKIPQPVHQKQDALVLLLDLSYSMKAADLPPSRTDRARQKLLDLLAKRREGQTGMIAYAGDAHIVTPLTDDTPTIANLAPALHPDMMPLPGSDPLAAVTLGLELLRSAGIARGGLLLVTDGVTAKDRRAIARLLEGRGVQLDILGVGTKTGAPIPLQRGGFVRDEAGTIVMPGLDEQTLRGLAEDTGGRYRRMQIDDSDLDYLLADNLLQDAGETLELQRTADSWEDKGYLLVLALLPLVLLLFRRGLVLGLLPLLVVAAPETARADPWNDLWLTPDQQGARALQSGDTGSAARLFDDPDWAGTAAYRDGDFETATEYFSTGDGADNWYNRGNALARAGRLEEAASAYKESLRREPGREDAESNLELVTRLQQQQERQQEQQQGESQQQQGEDGARDQQQQAGNQQDRQQAGEENGQQGSQQPGQQHQGDSDPEQDRQDRQAQQGAAQEEEQAQERPGHQGGDPQEQRGEPGERQLAQAPPGAEQEQPGAPAQVESSEDQERDQALEQWLRRVPDDPSGLLREKFRYESKRRQQEGQRSNSDVYW